MMLFSCQSLTSSSSSPTTTRHHYALRVLHPPPIHTCLRRSLITVPNCSLRLQEVSMEEDFRPRDGFQFMEENEVNRNEEEEEEKGISRILVPRQRYIPVSKVDLLDAILANLFNSQEDLDQFLLLSSCLDSILHAQHKTILEELRADYFMENNEDEEETTTSERMDASVNGKSTSDSIVNDTIGFLENRLRFASFPKSAKRLSVASRFQRTFMQLLNNAQFEELSAADLTLTSALNSDYLLTLPVYVDWKRASESNAIIFRRGYAAERQKGLLLVEKLDYLQSKLLQKIFFTISKPVGELGKWIDETVSNALQTEEAQDWIKRVNHWLRELSVIQSYFNNEQKSDGPLEKDELSDSPVPLWLAAQRAVSRYEGFLSPTGPRERLFRKFLSWIGRLPPTPETTYEHDKDSNPAEPYLRPSFLSRISLGDIWRPASRKYCGNDLWTMFKTSVSIFFSESMLQEPAHQELILLYNKDMETNNKDGDEVPPLQLKIYERIPIPDLPVVFPHKKLSFRIIDTVRLDIATIVGLLAYFINYKFEDIKASPSAIYLDVIAITALIIFVTRVALGYKQTWDRYQLLVNKTLYAKTLASGFGSVHFLLDASEQQQYKEAILTYAILLKAENGQVTCRQSVGDKCERFMYNVFKEKVEMPVDKAMDTLIRLGLVTETSVDGRTRLEAVPGTAAYESLGQLWSSLLV